ncbi:MAG: hypothetical protein ACRCYS_03725, partial [Beijerinckiaceae bacterium]
MSTRRGRALVAFAAVGLGLAAQAVPAQAQNAAPVPSAPAAPAAPAPAAATPAAQPANVVTSTHGDWIVKCVTS